MSNQGSHPTDKTDLSSNVPNSDWTMYGNVSQEWMQAKSPEELKEAAFRWSLSQDLKIRGLGLSLLGAIEAEGGEAQAQIRACLPWTVAVSHKIVPISIQEPFVVVLHAGEISVETLNLLMAYARRPVQWVQGTDAEVARELLSRYGSEIPATLLERFVNDPAVAWAGNPNPVLTVVAEPIENAVEGAQSEPAAAPVAELPDGDAEDEQNWGGAPEFPVEVLRDLRAVPMSEDESGIEFLVASPAENETLRALSELSQGAARFRIAEFEEVAAAWTAKYGDELTPATPNDTRNTIIEANEWAEEDEFEAELASADASEETTEEFVEPIAEAEIQPIAEVETAEPENLSPWQIAETRTPEDGLDSADLQALVSQYHVEEPEEPTAEVEVTVSEADAEADWDSLVAAVAEEESFEVEAADGIPEVQFDPQAWAQSLQPTHEEVPAAEPAAIEEVPVTEVESEASEESIVPQPEAVHLVPASLAWFARACPMQVRGDELVCWAMEPFDESLLTAIERRADRKLVVEPRSQEEVIAALQTAYPTDFAGVNAPVAVPELAQIEEEEANAPEIAPQDIDAELTQEVETALAEPVTSSDWDEEVAEADLPSDLADEWGNEISAEPTVEATSAGIAMPPPLPLDELKAPPTLSTDFTVAEGAAETEPVAEEPAKEFNAQHTGSVALDDLLARIGIARGDDFGAAPVAEPEIFEIAEPEVEPETVEVAESIEEVPVAEVPAPVAEIEPIEAELDVPAPPTFEIEEPEVLEAIEAEVAPVLTAAEAEVESFDAAPARPAVESTDDGFTLSATDEARAAWMEFMSGENKPTVQPRNDTTPIMIEQMLDRMNREIEVERASASAIPSADFKEEDDDGRASADAGFLTEEEAEESRIALEHASAIQRLMGQSLVPKPEILARFSRDTAIRLRTLPVTIEGGTLHVMGASALSEESVQMLSDESGLPIQLHLAPADHLQRMLDKAYPDPDRDLEQHTKVAELRRQQEMDDKGWLSKLMNRVNRGA